MFFFKLSSLIFFSFALEFLIKSEHSLFLLSVAIEETNERRGEGESLPIDEVVRFEVSQIPPPLHIVCDSLCQRKKVFGEF